MSKMTKTGKKLPPRQRTVRNILKWGKDHPTITGFVPKLDLKSWFLELNGEVKTSLKLSWGAIVHLPTVELVCDFHCVEGWSVLSCKWEGIPFTQILERAIPQQTAKHVTFECADGYITSLSLEELLEVDAILAYKWNDKLLEERFGCSVETGNPNQVCL